MAEAIISPGDDAGHLQRSSNSPPDSNSAPVEPEIALIRTAINRANSEVVLTGNNLVHGGNQDVIHRRVVDDTQFAMKRQSPFSPLYRFPPEVLSEIFLDCLFDVDDNFRSPIPLIHICRAWRFAALSTSQLWNTIPPLNLDSAKGREVWFIDVLRSYLSWSGESPLFLKLFNTASSFSSHPILDVIIPEAYRWRNVTIDINTTSYYALSEVRGHFDALRSLHLRLHVEPFFESMKTSTIFAVAPELRMVKVESEIPQDWLILPWSQLTEYSGKLKQLPRTIRALSQLVVCEVSAGLGPPITYDPLPQATLPSLRSLSLHSDWGSVHSPQLLDDLTLPSLNIFRFRGPSFFVNSFVSVLSRSGCALQSIVFHTTSLHEGDLARILTLTPLLVELDLDTCGMSWDIVIPLIFTPGESPLVPALRRLTFRSYHVDNHILDVIKSRSDRLSVPAGPYAYEVAPLECARISFRDIISCRTAHNSLEGWSGRDHPENANTLGWHNHLQKIIFGKKAPDVKKLLKLDSIFSAIENHGDIHVENLQFSRLHVLMHKISFSTPDAITGDDMYNFRARAGLLVDKWTPALLEHAKMCRWIIEGEIDLVYAKNPEFRMNDHDLLMSLAFGRDASSDVKWEIPSLM